MSTNRQSSTCPRCGEPHPGQPSWVRCWGYVIPLVAFALAAALVVCVVWTP